MVAVQGHPTRVETRAPSASATAPRRSQRGLTTVPGAGVAGGGADCGTGVTFGYMYWCGSILL